MASKIKITVKLFLSSTLYLLRILDIFELFGKKGVLILNYHRIMPLQDKLCSYSKPMIMAKEIFEEQMAFLRENYNIISFTDFIDIHEKKRAILPRSVVITFDDGYLDNYTYAFPVLKKYKIPATVFIATAYIDSCEYLWWDELAYCIKNIDRDKIASCEIESSTVNIIKKYIMHSEYSNTTETIDRLILFMNKLPWQHLISSLEWLKTKLKEDGEERPSLMLNWQQIKEMSDCGINFGCHTLTHPFLNDIHESAAFQEIMDSKTIIESKLGKSVDFFAYPSGKYNPKIIEIVKKCGFKAAVTTRIGRNFFNTPIHQLRRKDAGFLTIDDSFNKSYFTSEMNGIYDFLRN